MKGKNSRPVSIEELIEKAKNGRTALQGESPARAVIRDWHILLHQ